MANILDDYLGTKPVGRVAFPLFRLIGESKIFRVLAVTALGGLTFWFVFLHIKSPLSWWGGPLVVALSMLLAHIILNVPFSLVARCLSSQQEVDFRLNEALAQVMSDMQAVTESLPEVFGEMVRAVEVAKPSDSVHLLTPSPVYLSVDRFIAEARGYFQAGSKEIAALESINRCGGEVLSQRFRDALKACRGECHLVELDRRSAAVRAACNARMDRLLKRSDQATSRYKPFRRAYMRATEEAMIEIVRARRAEIGRPVHHYKMMAFPRVRFLLVGDTCWAQELPRDVLGILGEVRRLRRAESEPVFRNILRFLEMCESRAV